MSATTRRGTTALAALAVAGVAACRAPAAPLPGAPEDEVWVERARIDRGEARVVVAREEVVQDAVTASGRVALDDLRVQHVLSPVAGQISRLFAQPGDRVRKGSPLAALLSPDVATASSDLAKAEADLAQARAELARQERLAAIDAAPRRDLEAAQDAHAKAEAELARARQKAALLRSGGDARAQEYTLRSAIDGEVLARAAAVGMQVQGAYSGGTPTELFTLGDIERVWILADVAEGDLARVRPGAEATVRVAAWPGRAFRGRVDSIAGALDPALRTARARVALANPDRALKPEMLAQVSIAASAAPALALARGAVVPIEGEAFAWVEAGAAPGDRLRFKRRRLRVARGDGAGESVVVEAGLAAGERVLVDAAPRAAAGAGEVRITAAQLRRSGIRVEAVREGDVGEALTTGARVAFDDSRVAHVFSPVTGRVTRVLARPGQRVERGAPLLALASPDVGSAFADAAKARADLVAAEHEAARQRELYEAHAGARKDLEAAEATWQKARAELARAQQKTALLAGGTFDAVTQEYTLRSPIAGEVVARAATPGLEVQGQWSGAGAPVELFTVGALDPLWVLGEVYEMDVPSVREGLRVAVRVPAFPGRTFGGRVDWVADVLDPATRTARFRCAIENRERLLRPEMAPVLSVELPARRRLAVPRDAVLRLGDDTVVFVAAGEAEGGDAVFRRRKVVVGEEGTGGVVPVLDGLAPGDRVVVSGAIFLVGLL